jgi:hypothetical protein
MSNRRRDDGQFPLRWLEVVKIRDAHVPTGYDDWYMENGWRCIPVPPTSDPNAGWFIIDDSSDDRATFWGRWRYLLDGGGTA